MGLICTPYGYSGAAKVSGVVFTYQQVILADKPVAYWPLNETGGAVANDLSGNGFNMAYQNAPTLGAAAIAPGLGKSVLLNGSNQFVELASPPADLQITEGSFEGWWSVSVLPTSANTGGAIIANALGSGIVNFMLGFSANGGTAAGSNLDYFNYGNGFQECIGPQATANTTYHMVGTFDGTTAQLYVNGTLATSVSGSALSPNTAPIFIGLGDNGGYTTGLISNVAMYNTVLTAAQIQNHYNAGIA